MESLKNCFREPIQEIFDAARYLDAAVSAHITGNAKLAKDLIIEADMPVIREWTESIWGKDSPYVHFREITNAPPSLPKVQRIPVRMPNQEEKNLLHERDGYHCRFCGAPVIRAEVRSTIHKIYPDALPWGRKNIEQHAGFQAMWLQYDHVIPHARGGNNDIENAVITCAPCNFGRMDYLMEEVGISDPREREPAMTNWDGLERILKVN